MFSRGCPTKEYPSLRFFLKRLHIEFAPHSTQFYGVDLDEPNFRFKILKDEFPVPDSNDQNYGQEIPVCNITVNVESGTPLESPEQALWRITNERLTAIEQTLIDYLTEATCQMIKLSDRQDTQSRLMNSLEDRVQAQTRVLNDFKRKVFPPKPKPSKRWYE